jgi:predicted DNA-binding protein YlxM (UPF0122 family)
MEKFVRMTYLFDFYGPLLTEKQQDIMSRYYNENLSLAEIAETTGTSRQAVYDALHRSEEQLEELEAKLKLFETFAARVKALEALETAIFENTQTHFAELKPLLDALRRLL